MLARPQACQQPCHFAWGIRHLLPPNLLYSNIRPPRSKSEIEPLTGIIDNGPVWTALQSVPVFHYDEWRLLVVLPF
jgi:hypothetical protein